MAAILSQYLAIIKANLRLDFISEREVIGELQTHLEDKLEEMKEAGLSEDEALSTCLRLFGSAKTVARQLYEAHSQGSWRQALLASMPHLLFALLFALNWWQGIGGLTITLGLVLMIALYGWRHGRPVWLFPWLGYFLLPVIMAGLVLLYLPRGWSWLAIFLYLPLALWVVGSVTIQTIKRDWLNTALMVLPLPIILGWVLAVEPEGRFLEPGLEDIRHFAPWIGLSFLVLAVTVVAFVRLRQRWLRIALLFVSGLLTLAWVVTYAGGELGLPAFLLLILLMLGLLLGPALVERWLRLGNQQPMA